VVGARVVESATAAARRRAVITYWCGVWPTSARNTRAKWKLLRVRRELLGDHLPVLTIIIAGIYDPVWLLEIEAIAAR
jgi:hypothetical protein